MCRGISVFKLSTLADLMLYIRVELRNRYLKLLQIKILYCTEQKNDVIRSGSQSFPSKHTYVISLIIVIIILLID